MSLGSQYGQYSGQYDSRVVNYDHKVLYKIGHCVNDSNILSKNKDKISSYSIVLLFARWY